MQKFNLSIEISTNANVTQGDIAQAIRRLIDCGLSDAQVTIESGEGDVEAAKLATELNIAMPAVDKTPRVLVVVSGGVANPIYDAGVDVEVFDWDNFNADPEGTGGVPEHFADLAKPIDVPVCHAPDLPELILAIKQDILQKMQAGQIPSGVASFSALHDYCDANCLGGLCENTTANALIAKHGGRDQDEGMPQGMLDLINAAQTAIDTWLQDRWPAKKGIDESAPFSEVPGELGSAWHNLAAAENELAKLLIPYPKGTAAIHDGKAWFLEEGDSHLRLCIGDFAESTVTNGESRHDISLEWIDFEQDSLEYATADVLAATEAFELAPIADLVPISEME